MLRCLSYKLCFLQVVAHNLLLPEQESLYSSQTVTVLLLFFSLRSSDHLCIITLLAAFPLSVHVVLPPWLFFFFFG